MKWTETLLAEVVGPETAYFFGVITTVESSPAIAWVADSVYPIWLEPASPEKSMKLIGMILNPVPELLPTEPEPPSNSCALAKVRPYVLVRMSMADSAKKPTPDS